MHTTNALGKMIQEIVDKKNEAKGKLTSKQNGKYVSRKSIKTYYKMIANSEEFAVSNGGSEKTLTRAQAECSLQSTMAFILTVANTSFIIGKPPKNHPCRAKKGTFGAQLFYEMVCKAYKTQDVYPILPSMLKSTDDTTIFAHKGKVDKIEKSGAKKGIVSVDLNRRFQNLYNTDTGNKKVNGMRFRLTTTINAAGQLSRIYVTIKGLSEKELPIKENDDGVLVKKVPGFALSRVFDPSSQVEGYIVFIRSNPEHEESSYVRNFKHYHDNVYSTFIQENRDNERRKLNLETKEGEQIPSCLTSCGWMDGATDQLSAVKNLISEQCLSQQNLKAKQSAGKSGGEQPSDIGDGYKDTKRLEKTTTIDNIPNDSLSSLFCPLFNEWKESNEVNLGRKQPIAVDFLARIPYMLVKAFPPDGVRKSFLRNGTIDELHYLWPDIYKMMETRRGEMTSEERDLIFDSFDELFQEMYKNGHVEESSYDRLGFPPDFEEGEEGVNRDVGIEREHMQRAKPLSHPEQVILRDRIQQQRLMKETDQLKKHAEKEIKEKEEITNGNRDCEVSLLKAIDDNNEKVSKKRKRNDNDEILERSICKANINCFSKCSAAELKGFIHVHTFESCDTTSITNWKYPNRGGLEKAKKALTLEEEDNLISLAYRMKDKQIIFK